MTQNSDNKDIQVEKDISQENIQQDKAAQVVTPWEVQGGDKGLDYKKLVEKFGCQFVEDAQIQRIEKLTNHKLHPFLRRNIFFAQRDLNDFLDQYEKGKKCFIYTGRGPSSTSLHMGHLIPFMFTKYLQDAFKIPVIIQITDDEKVLWRGVDIDEIEFISRENIKDIIACGFDPDNTFIFTDINYMSKDFYKTVLKIQRHVTENQIRGIFGLTGSDNCGQFAFPPVQAAPSFPDPFPQIFGKNRDVRCLIPCAIDQDPYFRMTRDVAPRIQRLKPSLIESTFFPALQGSKGKMSASDQTSAIFLNDTANQIKKKINKYAFSGGKTTTEEHREFGADIEVDVSIAYLRFFLDDDEKLKDIETKYAKGELLTGEVKQILIALLQEMVQTHQTARSKVTEEIVDAFMTPRSLKS